MDFSDPSYHLPHFYELFAENAEEEDREFWRQAAAASICIRHATRRQDFLQNMQTMTGHLMQDIRKSSEGMTGTTAMHTAP